jgi:hypothetical protein
VAASVLERREDIVSSAERFVRHHKQQTDGAISKACARLAADPLASTTFHELLRSVRSRAPRLLDAPVRDDECHPGVETLINLARFRRSHFRPVAQWPGTPASWRVVVSSLAHHLLCRYPVPQFLAASWYATEDAYAEKKREWFVAHARGASFRSLDLPVMMTRRMEDIFLKSPPHVTVEYAIRRAELLALGASDDVVGAVLATRLASNLHNAAFWRTVWIFLAANRDAIDTAHIGPMVDFIQAVRHERLAVETPLGLVLRDPPQPAFSMKGRTVSSMMRLMREWHRRLGAANGSVTWAPSSFRPLLIEEPSGDPSGPPAVWRLMELTNAAQLRAEGSALRHCVGSYADVCSRGLSRIWSLRVQRGPHVRHLLTVEVDMRRRAVVQARGWYNRPASGKPLRLIQEWSNRERLWLSI